MKVYRRKRHSCSLCKPNKTGHAPRFKDRELADRKRVEKALQGDARAKEEL